MLEAQPTDPSDPRHRIYAALWNESHSIHALLEGTRVALLMEPFDAPPRVDDAGGPVLLCWVTRTARGLRYRRVRTSYDALLAAVHGGLRGHVLLARPDAGPVADEALHALGYRHEVLGQVPGYWFGPDREIPSEQPDDLPTGGVVPGVHGALKTGAIVMALIPVDGEWRPLSVEAIHTYSFTDGLSRGEQWLFVPALGLAEAPWPHALRVQLTAPIPADRIEAAYGHSASERSHREREYVQLEITDAPPTKR